MPKFLLDTNCFYSISNKTIDLNKVKEDDSIILATPLSVLEIAKCKNDEENFKHRKQAMLNLKNISNHILPWTPDYVIEACFGQKSLDEKENKLNIEEIIFCLINSNSYDEAKNGILTKNGITKLDFNLLENWKKEFSTSFRNTILKDDKDILAYIEETNRVNYQDMTINEIKKEAKKRYKEIADTDFAHLYMITGLGARAGLYSIEEYENAIDMNNFEEFIKLTDYALSKYNHFLKSYIKVFLEFRKEKLLNSPEKNDLFDLEFLVYLDIIEDCVFVTGEPKWVEIGNKINKNKFYHKEDFIKLFR
jgi:hypothetical protein